MTGADDEKRDCHDDDDDDDESHNYRNRDQFSSATRTSAELFLYRS